MIILEKQFLFGFASAFFVMILIAGIRKVIRFIMLRRKVKREIENSNLLYAPGLTINSSHINPEARAILLKHRRKLTHTRHPDPDWIKPLINESITMVKEIAAHFYPNSADPLLEPRITHITSALILLCKDINNFINQNRMLRMLDVSAKDVKNVNDFMNRPVVKRINQAFDIAKWAVRVLRYKNPIVTGSLLIGKNLTVRYLHSQLITFVGLRTIVLYSGQFTAASSPTTLIKT